MGKEHPVLIFISGPQQGQRVELTHPVAVLGRSADADVMFTEQYISRRHLRYEALPDGPTFEVLSKQGAWINGKRYKAGKRIVLETGDLIGLGLETQILFVSAGDDPEIALASCKELLKEQMKDAFGRKIKPEEEKVEQGEGEVQPEAAETQQEQGPSSSKPVEAAKDARKAKTAQMSPKERIEAERKARRRKIAIGLGIYFVVIIIGAIILKLTFKPTDKTIPMPAILTNTQISDAIRAEIKRTPNIARMRENLDKAISLYQQYGLDESHMYQCLRAFKEALAYSGQSFFDDPKHELWYHEILNRFTEVIQRKYRQACLWEKDKDWARAEAQFQEILVLFPEENNILFKNVLKHFNRVKYLRQKSKPARRRRW